MTSSRDINEGLEGDDEEAAYVEEKEGEEESSGEAEGEFGEKDAELGKKKEERGEVERDVVRRLKRLNLSSLK